MTYFQGDFAGTATYARNSVALGREAGDLFSVAFGLGLQTIAAAEAGDVGLALRLAGECRAAASASGNPWTAGPALYVLGFLAIREGDYDEASRLWRRRGTPASAPWASSIHVSCLVGLRVVQGRHAEANALGARASRCVGTSKIPVRTAWCLDGIAAASGPGSTLSAARLWGASDATPRQRGGIVAAHASVDSRPSLRGREGSARATPRFGRPSPRVVPCRCARRFTTRSRSGPG